MTVTQFELCCSKNCLSQVLEQANVGSVPSSGRLPTSSWSHCRPGSFARSRTVPSAKAEMHNQVSLCRETLPKRTSAKLRTIRDVHVCLAS